MDNQQEQYLKLLSIFHYVVGGLAALFACFPIFHLVVGISMMSGGFFAPPPEEGFPVMLFGLMFTLIPAAIILTGWALAGVMIATGYFISQRIRHTFCLVVAGIECIFMPFGTVLGVFTIILLTKPAVQEQFASNRDSSASESSA